MEREVVQGLIERGLPEHIAYGIAGNISVESRLDPGINEVSPLVEGSRGGYGLNQWTGPRRRQFESYAEDRGRGLSDLDTQLDFTLWELENTERNAMNALMGAENVSDAARIYSQKFLRPGIPHLDRRISEANRLAGAGYEGAPQGRAAPEQSAPERPNPLRLAYSGQNAADFMVQQNQLATRPDAYTRYL